MIAIAHLSDIHIDSGPRSQERAARVLSYVNGLSHVDAVVVTGDLADNGALEEYAQVASLLKSPHMTITCPGNHDKRPEYRVGLLGEPAGDAPVNQVMSTPGAVYVSLDSSIPGRPNGFLAEETLAWLDEVLTGTGTWKPAFVCFHHPPVDLSVPAVDRIRQFDEARLAGVLSRHSRVAALLCGHAHTAASTSFAGLPLLVAPGVVSTSLLPFEPNGARGWDEGGPLDLDAPPSLYFHVLHDDGRLTSHLRAVP
ncbi:metallophosphoesterase [Amycolatopsis sp. NPDC059657]|uniref:metallophosphoesterase n=1 Tax=Amycolatopsis sp. NPDC059657 TaxID=3346899 RepID=UPI00366B1056